MAFASGREGEQALDLQLEGSAGTAAMAAMTSCVVAVVLEQGRQGLAGAVGLHLRKRRDDTGRRRCGVEVPGRGDVGLGGLERLEVGGGTLVVHQGRGGGDHTGKDEERQRATTMRRIQPHTASPVAASAGLCASTASV